MKRVSILFAAALCSMSLMAQTAATEPAEKAAPELKHYFNVGVKAGYSAMIDGTNQYGKKADAATDFSGKKLLGGPGAGLGVTYELEYGHFLFDVGLEADYLRSTSRYDFEANRQLVSPAPMTYNYRFTGWNETRQGIYAGLPIMAGAQYGNVYFLLGGKVAYGILGKYQNYGQYDVTAYDPALAGPIGGTSHGLGLHDVSKSDKAFAGDLKFAVPEVRLMAEVGYDLDPWMQAKKRRASSSASKKKSKYEPFNISDIHYRIAAFAEYGVLNQNGNAHQDALAFEDKHSAEATGSNSVLSQFEGSKLNNLFAGVKFTVQFNVFNKKPIKPVIPPSYFTLNILDENDQPTMAKVQVNNETKQRVAVQAKDIRKGVLTRKYPIGEYSMIIQKADYYSDTIYFAITDNGTNEERSIRLRPLPKIEAIVEAPKEEIVGQTFVLHNLFFATAQTTILPESEEALTTLYNFMMSDVNHRIRIIGHTDNVGKDEANQILSEGRAEAVRQALIERGIAAERMEAEGRGETEPIADNDTEEGRAENRRVEVEILQ